MSRKKDEKRLDEIISRTINSGKPQFDPEKWKQKYPKEFQMLQSLSTGQAHTRRPSIWRAVCQSPITKLAAAAVLLIGLGYAVGRLSAPQPNVEQLQAALEPAIRQNLLDETKRYWQLGMVSSYVRLKDELHQQVRRDLAEFADQILAASGTLTEQRLMELIQLIEDARMRDRQRVATALEKIEFNRLQDKTLFGSGLVTLAAQTSELLETKQN